MSKLPSHLTFRNIVGNDIDLKKLNTTVKAISCEALAYHRPNVGLLTKLSALFEDVSEYIADQVNGIKTVAGQVLTFNRAAKILKTRPYSEFIDLAVPIIPGQTVSWFELTNIMLKHSLYVAKLEDTMFTPLNTYVGSVLNNPERMGSAANRPTIPSDSTLKELTTSYQKAISNSTSDTARFGAVFRRNTEWEMVRDNMNKIGASLALLPPKKMQARVEETNKQLTRLLEDVQDQNLPYRPTSASVDYLVKMIQRLAEEVTLYAALHHHYDVATQCLKNTEEILVKSE